MQTLLFILIMWPLVGVAALSVNRLAINLDLNHEPKWPVLNAIFSGPICFFWEVFIVCFPPKQIDL